MNNLLRQSMRLQSVPAQQIPHSTFSIPFNHTTSFNFGDLVPFYFSEVLPGSTFEVDTNMVARMITPIHPVFGNANIDYYYFFVPNRLVWDHWPNFCGENTEGAWAPEVSYEIPHMSVTPDFGDCYDHFGLIPGKTQDVNVLPFRAYRLIWNEWFRNENTQDPLLVNRGDTETDGSYAKMAKVCRYPDLFSTALPSPQKGQPVELPLIGNAPVITGADHLFNGTAERLKFVTSDGDWNINNPYIYPVLTVEATPHPAKLMGAETSTPPSGDGASYIVPSNLWADLSGVTAATVNHLREAFATQRVLEAFARCGTRYTEMLRGIFNTISPDARLQRPEYLGGDRVRVDVQAVMQTSSTDATSPQGNTAAFSHTVTRGKNFTHTFTEHGLVIGVMCARVLHTYQQGIEKYWSKRDFFDFYLPQLAHIGEQPILNKEIYLTGNSNYDDKPFGYQEAWYEYRFKPNLITSSFRSSAPNTLDVWHYGDYYNDLPTLSSGWMQESSSNVDRTLAVSSELSDQLLVDIYQINKATLPMPVYSVPGLIDHF